MPARARSVVAAWKRSGAARGLLQTESEKTLVNGRCSDERRGYDGRVVPRAEQRSVHVGKDLAGDAATASADDTRDGSRRRSRRISLSNRDTNSRRTAFGAPRGGPCMRQRACSPSSTHMMPVEVVRSTRPKDRAGNSWTTQLSMALAGSAEYGALDEREGHVEARADHTRLVDAAVELDDDLA